MKKKIRCNFFYFEEPENGEGRINALFEQQHALVSSKKVHNIQVSDFYLRITYLEKKKDAMKHFWVGIVERLETTEEAVISDLNGSSKTLATGEDEGPIKNTGFVYDPSTNTVALHRKIGGVNNVNFGIFIRKLLKDTNTITNGVRSYKMHVLPDLDKLERLRKAPHIHELEYSFKLPKKIEALKDKKRSVIGDLLLASHLGGEFMKVRIKAGNMNVRETIDKVFKIRELGEENVNSLRVVTEHDSIEEPLDLLSSNFTDYIEVDFKKNQKETPTLVMESIYQIFSNQRSLIESMYLNNSSL